MDLADSIVQCPYDANHKITKSRLQRHLIKCERNYPVGYKVTCPYNASHRYFKHEMEEHIQKCPQKIFVDPFLYQKEPRRYMMSEHTNSLVLDDDDESWETDDGVNIDCSETLLDFNDTQNTIQERVPQWVEQISNMKLNNCFINSSAGTSSKTQERLYSKESYSDSSYVGTARGRFMKLDSDDEDLRVYKKIGLGRGKPMKK